MENPKTEEDVLNLFSRIVETKATADEIAWLDQAIQTDPRIRWLYWEFMTTESEMTTWIQAQEPSPQSEPSGNASLVHVDLEKVFGEASDDSKSSPTRIPSQQIFRMVDWRQHPIQFLGVTALATAIIWGVAVMVIGIKGGDSPSNTNIAGSSNAKGTQPHVAPQKFAASLVRNYNAQWVDGTPAITEGTQLDKDQKLQLAAGFSVIEFSSGARVVLQAPATFVITGRNGGHLEVGQLTARVGGREKGFTVSTPKSSIRDVGTEFGVHVEPNGEGYLHVFEGVVELTPDSKKNDPGIRIRSGMSASLEGDKSLLVNSATFQREKTLGSENLVANGGFEVPIVGDRISKALDVSTGGLTNWRVAANGSKIKLRGEHEHYLAFNSNRSTAGGSISQDLDTVIGTEYLVKFSVSGSEGPRSAQHDPDGSLQQVFVNAGGVKSLTQAVTINKWTTHSFSFTATATSTRLTFTDDLQVGGVASDLLLDQISVTAK